jgi:hypothetical protein
MNRSYSKIRHIQEANQKLEKRLMNEQAFPMFANAGEVIGDLGKDIGSHPHIEAGHSKVPQFLCAEYYPNRDQAFRLIQGALKSPKGSANPSNPDVINVHNAVALGDVNKIKQLISQMFFKLKNVESLSSFIKSYNAKGFDLFKELDKFPMSWDIIIPMIQDDLKEKLGVAACKKNKVNPEWNDPRKNSLTGENEPEIS